MRKMVKPKTGSTVLNPWTNAPLAPEGERVPWGPYWERRQAEGSIEVLPEPKTKKPGRAGEEA